MRTEEILKTLESHLKARLTRVEIALFPNNPRTYYLAHPIGAVLIAYAQSKFDAPRPTQAITQTRRLNIALTVLTRDLHEDAGALDLLDELRLILVGLSLPHCTPLFVLDEFFNGQDEETGVWQYQLVLQTTTVQVERQEEAKAPRMTALLAQFKQSN